MQKFNYTLLILPILIILVVVAKKFLESKGEGTAPPYIKKESLLTEAEKNFYSVLTQIMGNDYLLFSKVRILDILDLPKGIDNKQYYQYKNKIQSKHVDFLICDKENIRPLLVIELDDSSHLKASRKTRDALVDNIFNSAKLPILHVKNSSTYNKVTLLNDIAQLLTPPVTV